MPTPLTTFADYTLSALSLLLAFVFVLAWVILAIRARRKKDIPPAFPAPSNPI